MRLTCLSFQRHQKVRAILQDNARGLDWLVAAIIHGSMGYYTPLGAENLVNDCLRGERENYSERCSTCFHTDLEKEIMHDISAFEELSADKQRKLTQTIKEVRKMDSVSQTTFGLFYPTSGS
jgi:hypothetical protein